MEDTIVVVEYDPRWPQMFEVEKVRILGVIGEKVVAIEHMGSTAIPGLGAKPIIDIMVAVPGLDDAPGCVQPLQSIGYEYVPEFEAFIPERRYFRKGTPRSHHLHLYAADTFWNRHELLFRDYVRAHPEVAREYFELKKDLAVRYAADRQSYTDAKTAFIESVVARAQAEKKPIGSTDRFAAE